MQGASAMQARPALPALLAVFFVTAAALAAPPVLRAPAPRPTATTAPSPLQGHNGPAAHPAVPRIASTAGARAEAPKPITVPPLARAPKLVVYDWDGTLGDTYPQIRYIVSRAAKDAGVAPVERPGEDPYRAVIDGGDLPTMFRRLAPAGTSEQLATFVARFEHHSEHAPPELVRLKPGVAEELARVRARHPGVKLAILTSRDQHIVELFVRLTGLSHVFDKIVGTARSPIPHKPSPEGLFIIARELGIEPKDAVMIGDTSMDVGAGKAAGMSTIAVTDGMGTRASLVESQPDYLLEQLPGIVDALFPRPPVAKSARPSRASLHDDPR